MFLANPRPARRECPTVLTWLLAAWLALALAACSTPGAAPHATYGGKPIDTGWLNRLTYSVDTETANRYRDLGQARFLEAELHPQGSALAAPALSLIASLGVDTRSADLVLTDLAAEQRRVRELPEGEARETARKAMNDRGNVQANAAARREILRALYAHHQLEEQMVWFWLNHFSVYANKAQLRWLIASYGDSAIRPHALGRFRDLLLATLEYPAMLQYLDNAQNAVGHVNENYARELMELHTLGVDAGYRQADVQELARILTGVGIPGPNSPPKLRPKWRHLYLRKGGFEFNPARHDFGDKLLLGHRIRGSGFAEVEQAVLILTREPACARFVSRKLVTAFVADDPPVALVERVAARFIATDGDIVEVLRVMFTAPELSASLGHKFRDPMHYVIGAVRLAYDGQYIVNARPILNWLNGLGEPLFGRQTPDGYPLTQLGWASSGQLSRRFEIARAIGSGTSGLFTPDAGDTPAPGFPRLTSPLYYAAIEPTLSTATRVALGKATSQQEWNTLLLASPELNYR
jgi:uncharacterized protein (DUF1800 family)